MFNLKDISKAIEQIAHEKGLDPQKVMEAIESSIAAAYKKEYGSRGEIVKAKFNLKSGELKFWQVKTVVDETTTRIIEEPEEGAEALPAEAMRMPREADMRSDANDEPLLPRYNPERHIFFAEAKKLKKDVVLGD